MSEEEPISRRGMLIGLRIAAVAIFIAGCFFGAYGSEVRMSWEVGFYGAAIGGFLGRGLFWFILAAYAWRHSRKYKAVR